MKFQPEMASGVLGLARFKTNAINDLIDNTLCKFEALNYKVNE